MKDLLNVRTERRLLTVLFCDMIDSTRHQYNMDPEQFGAVLATYRQIIFDQVKRHRGHVARVIGDGVLAFFGWPQALGKDTQMAVTCALEIGRDIARRCEADPGASAMAVRMGIETGWVLVGDIGPSDYIERDGVVGPAPNIASRLQHLARRNGVVVGEKTLSMLPDWFLIEPADTAGINLPVPVQAAHVLGISDHGDPLARLQPSHWAPLIGRDDESEWLAALWRLAADGAGQAVLISGEPGIGKSRLVRAFLDSLPAGAYHAVGAFCVQQSSDDAFHPLIPPLLRHLGLDAEASHGDILAAARTSVRQIGQAGEVAGLALAALLGVPVPREFSTAEIRRAMFAVLTRWVAAQAAGRPLILVIEDFQWADPSFATFVERLAGEASGMALLLLITHRADHAVDWAEAPAVHRRQVGPLTREDATKLAAAVLETATPADAAMIAERAEGIPLFVEEFARISLDQDRRLDQLPASVSQVLAARLDALGPARHLAHIAAVIGEEAPATLLAQLSGLSDAACVEQTDLLLAQGIMTQRQLGDSAMLSFRHGLLREAAYYALPTVHRTRMHGRVAQHLRSANPSLESTAPAVLGWHHEKADEPAQAAEMFRRASASGLMTGAYVEAETHARRAVRLGESSPDDSRTGSIYSGLQLLGEALIATRGEGSTEVRATYERATRLALQARAMHALPQLLRGLCASYQVRGPLSSARELSDRLLGLAMRDGDDALIADAERRLGWCSACQGDLAGAGALLESSVARAAKSGAASPTSSGIDTRVLGLSNLAILSAFRDGAEETRRRTDVAVQAVEVCRKPLAIAYGYGCVAIASMIARDAKATGLFAQKTERAAAEHGLVYWTAMARILSGWADARSGDTVHGLADLREGLVLYGKTESLVLRPLALMMLSDAEADAGSFDAALRALDEAMEIADSIGAVVFRCLLWLSRARVLRSAGDTRPAQDAAARAIEAATAIGATAIAQRAAVMGGLSVLAGAPVTSGGPS